MHTKMTKGYDVTFTGRISPEAPSRSYHIRMECQILDTSDPSDDLAPLEADTAVVAQLQAVGYMLQNLYDTFYEMSSHHVVLFDEVDNRSEEVVEMTITPTPPEEPTP